jgi:TP901 family phage tail tape measure protein
MSGLDQAQRSWTKFGSTLQVMGFRMGAIWTATVGAMTAATIKFGVEHEKAFANVKKTITVTKDESDAYFTNLEKQLIEIAKRTPFATTELSNLARIGGQLGVQKENIAKFTETIAKLGVAAAELPVEEAAVGLARIISITGASYNNVDRLASVLARLGDSFATTESRILNFATRISGLAKITNMSAQETLGLGAAFTAVVPGVELVATQVSKALGIIASSVETGGDKLELLNKLVEHTGESFTVLWKENASRAIAALLKGLELTRQAGTNIFGVLEKLGLSNQRAAQAFAAAAGASGKFREALDLQEKEFRENTKIAEEMANVMNTVWAQSKILFNLIKIAGINIFDAYRDILMDVISAAQMMMKALLELTLLFGKLPNSIKFVTAALALLPGLLAAAAMGAGMLSSVFATLSPLLVKLGSQIVFAGFSTAKANVEVTKFVTGTLPVAATNVASTTTKVTALTGALRILGTVAAAAATFVVFYEAGKALANMEVQGKKVYAHFGDMLARIPLVDMAMKVFIVNMKQNAEDQTKVIAHVTRLMREMEIPWEAIQSYEHAKRLLDDYVRSMQQQNKVVHESNILSDQRLLWVQGNIEDNKKLALATRLVGEEITELAKAEEIIASARRLGIIESNKTKKALTEEEKAAKSLADALKKLNQEFASLGFAVKFADLTRGQINLMQELLGLTPEKISQTLDELYSTLDIFKATVNRGLTDLEKEFIESKLSEALTKAIGLGDKDQIEDVIARGKELGISLITGTITGLTGSQIKLRQTFNDLFPESIKEAADDLLAVARNIFFQFGGEISGPIKDKLLTDFGKMWTDLFKVGQYAEAEELAAAARELGLILPEAFVGPLQETQDETEEATKKTLSFKKALDSVSDAFRVLGISSSSTLGKILGSISVAAEAGERLMKAWDNMTKEGGGLDLDAGNLLGAGMAALGAAGSIAAATGSGSRAERVAGGASVGAAFGGQIMPGIGHAIGAGVGALIGAFRGRTILGIMKDVGRLWGTEISEELAKTIEQSMKDLDLERFEATLLHFTDILAAAGGITASNMAVFRNRFLDLLSATSAGTIEMSDGIAAIGEGFAAMLPGLQALGTEGSLMIGQVINDMMRFGLVTEEVNDHLAEQGKVLLGALAPALEWIATLENMTAEEAEAFQAVIVAAFAAAVASTGSFITAVAQLGDTFGEALDNIKESLGADGSNLIGPIESIYRFIKNNQEALNALKGITDGLDAMAQMGILTRDSLAAMGEAVHVTFDRIVEETGNAKTALKATWPEVVKLYDMYKRLGMDVPPWLQDLIDKGEKMGLSLDIPTTVLGALREMVSILKDIARALGAVEDEARNAGNAIGNIPDPPRPSGNRPGGAINAQGGLHMPPIRSPEFGPIYAHMGEEIHIDKPENMPGASASSGDLVIRSPIVLDKTVLGNAVIRIAKDALISGRITVPQKNVQEINL